MIANQQTHAGLESQPGLYNNFVTWQLGFTFQAPLGMRSPLASTRQAQYILLRSRAYLQQVVHQTTHSLARFFLEIDANYKQFKTAARLRGAAAQRLEAQRAYYEEGRITIDRFLDAVSQYATAVATEAQYKTTYNISIVALEEAKGTLLAYDNIAVAEGPNPRKAYIQAGDIQDAHKQFHILPDGPQVPKAPFGPLNPDPIDEHAPPGVEAPTGPNPQPAPAGPLGPRPSTLPPYTPATELPQLSQAGPATMPGQAAPGAGASRTVGVSLTSGTAARNAAASVTSVIDPSVPGMGSTSVAASLGRTTASAAPASAGYAPAGGPPSRTPTSATRTLNSAATPPASSSSRPTPAGPGDLPPLPVSIDLPPLPPG